MKFLFISLFAYSALFAKNPTDHVDESKTIELNKEVAIGEYATPRLGDYPNFDSAPVVQNRLSSYRAQLYGQVSAVIGPGISLRKRNGTQGFEYTLNAGVFALLGGAVSCGVNWLHFPKDKQFYYGYGISLAVVTWPNSKVEPAPLIPIFWGYSFKHGFIEGGLTALLYIPIPTIRAGISF